MGPGDFLPPVLSNFFRNKYLLYNINCIFTWIFTVRLTQKFGVLSNKIKSIDEIFLISVAGLVWLFRSYWIGRMLNPLFTNIGLFFSFILVPLLAFFSIAIIVIASLYDLEIVFNRKICNRKKFLFRIKKSNVVTEREVR